MFAFSQKVAQTRKTVKMFTLWCSSTFLLFILMITDTECSSNGSDIDIVRTALQRTCEQADRTTFKDTCWSIVNNKKLQSLHQDKEDNRLQSILTYSSSLLESFIVSFLKEFRIQHVSISVHKSDTNGNNKTIV